MTRQTYRGIIVMTVREAHIDREAFASLVLSITCHRITERNVFTSRDRPTVLNILYGNQ
jgi:hypothetical protein